MLPVLCLHTPQISSPVIERLLQYRPLMRRAVIMFQAEFAERMVAKYERVFQLLVIDLYYFMSRATAVEADR